MKKFLGKVFNVHEGEYGRVFLSWLIFLLIMSGIIIGRNARDSIFLKNVGIQFLPYMYVLNAVFVVFVSMVYAAYVDKMDRTKFMVVSLALYAGVAFLTRVLLVMKLQWFYSACYVVVQILWLVGLMQFWTFMGDVFDTRESKRLFPVVGTGGLLGMVVAGFGAKYVVAVIGTDNLFLVWSGMLVACIFLILALSRQCPKSDKPAPPKPAEKPKSQIQEFKEGFAYIKELRLLQTLIFINLGMWIVFTIVDYEFSKVMNQTYTQKDDLTAFLGVFRAAAGFLCFVVQFGLTTRLINRFGVGRVIAIHPAFMVGGTAFLMLKFGYASAFFSKFGDHVLLYTVQDSSYQMLYNPIPLDKRGRARAFVEGYVKPISMGLAGIILILSVMMKSDMATCAIAVFFAGVWVFFSLRANADYVQALTENLTSPDSVLRAQAVRDLAKLGDKKNLAALRQVLDSGDREMTLFALEMFETINARDALPDVRKLLDHEDTHIRAGAISTLSAFEDRESLKNIAELLEDKKPSVRRAAAKALGRLGNEEALVLLEPLLHDPKKKVRAEALSALVHAGGLDGVLLAGEVLKKLLESKNKDKRIQGIDILRDIKIRHFTPTLLPMMHEEHPAVRRHAVRAVAKLKDARAVNDLLRALADPRCAQDAAHGLAALGKKATPSVMHAAEHAGQIPVRCRALGVLAKSPPGEVLETLIAALHDAHPSMRAAALHGISRLKLSPSQKEAVDEPISHFIGREIDYILLLRFAGATFKTRLEKAPPAVFTDMLEEQAVDSLERIFEALSVVLDGPSVRSIWSKLRSGDARLTPIALEALENIGHRDITSRITPLFEERSPEDTIAFCKKNIDANYDIEALFKHFAEDPAPWVRCCTAVAAGECASQAVRRDILARLVQDADPLVAETARWISGDAASKESDMITMEKVLFLKTVGIFAGMSGEQLVSLAEIVEEVPISDGEVIFHQGEAGEDMFVIVSGGVQVVTEGDGGGETLLATLEERECLGEMAILDDEPRSATARAAGDTLLLKITREAFHELIGDDPGVAFGVFRVFTRRLRQANVEQQHQYATVQGTV